MGRYRSRDLELDVRKTEKMMKRSEILDIIINLKIKSKEIISKLKGTCEYLVK